MLRDRYEPMDLFAEIPCLGMQMDPVLAQLDRLLDHDAIFQAVEADLAQRHPRTRTDGRPSTPVEVILCLLVIKHLYGWSYAQTEQFVADSLVLRQACRVYAERVPDDTTLIRWARLIQPATLQTLLDHVTDLARQLKVTEGRKLRIDGTVVGVFAVPRKKVHDTATGAHRAMFLHPSRTRVRVCGLPSPRTVVAQPARHATESARGSKNASAYIVRGSSARFAQRTAQQAVPVIVYCTFLRGNAKPPIKVRVISLRDTPFDLLDALR